MEQRMIKNFMKQHGEDGRKRKAQVKQINEKTIEFITGNGNQYHYYWDSLWYQYLIDEGYRFDQIFTYVTRLNGEITAYTATIKYKGDVYRFPIEYKEKIKKMEMKGWYGNGEILTEKSLGDKVFSITKEDKEFLREFVECVSDYFKTKHPSIRARVMAQKAPLRYYSNVGFLFR